MRKYRVALLGGILALSAGCKTVEFGEAEMFRPRPGEALSAQSVEAAGYRFEPLEIRTDDGIRLRGGLLTRADAQTTILFFGGNIATAAITGLRRAESWQPLGINVVLVDYRSYGGSEAGPMSAAAFRQDGLKIFDFVAALPQVRNTKLIVHGHSMGSLIAAHVAVQRKVDAVVLESSATTTRDYVARQVPWIARPFVRVKIDQALEAEGNLQAVPLIDEPLLIIAGAKDRDTPPDFARALFAASTLPTDQRQLLIVPDAGHSDVFSQPLALAAYQQFIRTVVR